MRVTKPTIKVKCKNCQKLFEKFAVGACNKLPKGIRKYNSVTCCFKCSREWNRVGRHKKYWREVTSKK